MKFIKLSILLLALVTPQLCLLGRISKERAQEIVAMYKKLIQKAEVQAAEVSLFMNVNWKKMTDSEKLTKLSEQAKLLFSDKTMYEKAIEDYEKIP